MLLQLGEIKIKKRIRKEPGNLEPLMKSMQEYGLMNPVVVNSRLELIAGYRRLESARRLGWENIEATMMATSGELPMLELEIEENVQRSDFSPAELAAALKLLEKLRNPGVFRRLWFAIKRFFKGFFGLQ
ncbi:MAG: ParB N-terminal domain-containing protein [Deltaproteobacteria bacterium]|nr:ParB N-terminal domain-containing protein [Deltaproteobacteria bacterium]